MLVRVSTVLAFLLLAQPAAAQARWNQLPPTPALPTPDRSGIAAVNGAKIWYAEFGRGDPVVLVHGGLANSNYWGLQIAALAAHHHVIVLDSRGEGRSTRDRQPIGYALMSADVLAVMDTLHIERTALVGWSDGAIIGLDIAIHYPDRLARLFAFAANSDPSGLGDISHSAVFAESSRRAPLEYAALSPTPGQLKSLEDALVRMWGHEPHFSDAQLRGITVPTWIVDGDHDEAIRRTDTDHMAALIPGAKEVILPDVNHFAFMQDPAGFNAAVLAFLDGAAPPTR